MSNKSYLVRLVETVGSPASVYEIRLEESAGASVTSPPAADELTDWEKERLQFEYKQAQAVWEHYDKLSWQTGGFFIAAVAVLSGLAFKDGFGNLAGWRGLTIVFGIPAVSLALLLLWRLWYMRHRSLYRLREETLHRLEIKLKLYHFLRAAEVNLVVAVLEDAIKNRNAGVNDGALYGRQIERKRRLTVEQLETILLRVKETRGQALSEEERNTRRVDVSFYDRLDSQQQSRLHEALKAQAAKVKRLADAKRAAGASKADSDPFEPLFEVEYATPPSHKLVAYLMWVIPALQLLALLLAWWFQPPPKS